MVFTSVGKMIWQRCGGCLICGDKAPLRRFPRMQIRARIIIHGEAWAAHVHLIYDQSRIITGLLLGSNYKGSKKSDLVGKGKSIPISEVLDDFCNFGAAR